MKTLFKVALVGRPNVGKSTLFNRLVRKRQAVIADVAGTTRDRLEQEMEWEGKAFSLVDMAGLELTLPKNTTLTKATQAQVEKGLEEADLLVWVVDGGTGLTAMDRQVGELLRRFGKPVIVAINKIDHPKHEKNVYEFSELVFTEQVTLSGLHARGIPELMEAIAAHVPAGRVQTSPERELAISIVGRPNVGKSTLLNALIEEERAVVSDVPGTTRDSVDTVIPAEQIFGSIYTKWKQVRIIDTAGIRRRGKIEQGIENWSILRTYESIDQSEVVLFLLDATEGMVNQDMQIAQRIVDAGRAVILLVNKWDLVLKDKGVVPTTPEDQAAQEVFLDHLRVTAPFLYWLQVVFISAEHKLNLDYLGKLILAAYQSWDLEITEEELAEVTEALRYWPRLKNLTKITLEHNRPPVFHLHVEGKDLPHFSTVRAVENTLREHFSIGPTPVKMWSVPSISRPKRPNRREGKKQNG